MAVLALQGIFQVVQILSLFYLYNSSLGYRKPYLQVHEFNSVQLIMFQNFFSWGGEPKEVSKPSNYFLR